MTVICPGGSSRIEHRAAMQDDPQRRRPNITRARDYIGWQPRVSLSSLLTLSSVQLSATG